MKKTVSVGSSVTLYAGNYVYTGPSESETLQFFNHPEGYASPDGLDGYDYLYQYKDHLGNVRLSYVDNGGTLEIVEENNYYPFGLKHKGYNTGTSPLGNDLAQKWKYNGVELDETTGLYEMDFRQYDAAIGRFNGIDPVTHFDYSTYQAFDNNPTIWSDPSGANAQSTGDCYTCDVFGRQTIENGRYITVSERRARAKKKDSESNQDIDILAAEAVKEVAKLYVNDVDFTDLSEGEKQVIFKNDELSTIGILLWEFATGTGKNRRVFVNGKHPFASSVFDGRITDEIFSEFNQKLNEKGYDWTSLRDTEYIDISLEFSPRLNPSSWLDSLHKHMNSNKSQFFIGGAIAYVKIKDQNLIIQIYNETSRNSLMLHGAKNYDRNEGDKSHRPLSTIKQNIFGKFKLIKD